MICESDATEIEIRCETNRLVDAPHRSVSLLLHEEFLGNHDTLGAIADHWHARLVLVNQIRNSLEKKNKQTLMYLNKLLQYYAFVGKKIVPHFFYGEKFRKILSIGRKQ